VTDHWTTIEQASRDVGTFHVACRRLDEPGSFSLRDTEVVPIASMFKVLLALEVAEAFARRDLRPDAQLRVTTDQHCPGGLGLNQFTRPAAISMADLLYLSLALSDNTASDLLLAHIGLDALHARAEALGLETVHVVGNCRTLLRNAGEDLGYASEAEAVEADWAPTTDAADLVLERTTRASTADLAQLASLLALERAVRREACRLVRDLMRRQVWKFRFAGAFSPPAWTRAAKTGTLQPWRGEFGVLARRDGAQLAVAVVVRQHRRDTPDAVVDRAVGAVARSAAGLTLGERRSAVPWDGRGPTCQRRGSARR
jgi:beta-lactamase class A